MAKPDFIAYNVREYDKRDEETGRVYKESSWTRIGVAFAHKKGGGFDVVLEAFPLDGRITLRVPTEKPKGEEQPAE